MVKFAGGSLKKQPAGGHFAGVNVAAGAWRRLLNDANRRWVVAREQEPFFGARPGAVKPGSKSFSAQVAFFQSVAHHLTGWYGWRGGCRFIGSE
jgi:hypothetical protein